MLPEFAARGLCFMKIASIVLNSVRHDARVIKEAESLAGAGHEVRIFGIQDNNVATPQATTPGGVHISLAAWRTGYLRLRLRALHGLLALGVAVSVLAGGFAAGAVWAALAAWSWSPPLAAGIAASLGLLLLFLRRWRRQREWLLRQPELCKPGFPGAGSRALPLRVLGWMAQGALQTLAHPLQAKASFEMSLDRALRARAMRGELLRRVLEFAPDVVHCHDVGTLPLGLAVKRRSGARVVYDSHELHAEIATLGLVGRLVTLWRERQAAPLVDGCVTVNEFIAAELATRYPALPEPVVVCNAVRPLPAQPRDDGRLRRAAGLEHGVRILLYQGGFSPGRGLVQLVQAAALLPDDWAVVFMGWGRLEQQLRQEAARVDPAGRRVRFIPAAPQQELPFWTAGASLGVIPYENVGLNHWYCSPNKLWEYPLAGVPILASPFPFLRSLVQGRGLGWLLASPLEPEDIAAAVARLSDDDLAAARERCEVFISEDTWERYAGRLLQLYDTLA